MGSLLTIPDGVMRAAKCAAEHMGKSYVYATTETVSGWSVSGKLIERPSYILIQQVGPPRPGELLELTIEEV